MIDFSTYYDNNITIISKYDNKEKHFKFNKHMLGDLSYKFKNEIILSYKDDIVNTFLNIIYNHYTKKSYHLLINIHNCMELYELEDYFETDLVKQLCFESILKIEFCEKLYKFILKFDLLNYNNLSYLFITKYLGTFYDGNYLDRNFFLIVSKYKMPLKKAYEKYIKYLGSYYLNEDWIKNIDYNDETLIYIIINADKYIETNHDYMIKKCIEYIKLNNKIESLVKDLSNNLTDDEEKELDEIEKRGYW